MEVKDMQKTANSTSDEANWVPMATQFFFGLVGNVFALMLLFLSRKQHRWIPFYRLYTGLVLSDLSIWLLTSPLSIARYASQFTWTFPPAVCQYDSFMLMFGLLSSALFVCAMSADRLKAMCCRQDELHGKCYTWILICFWCFSGCYSAIHLVTHHTKNFFPGSWCYMDYVNLTSDFAGTVNAYTYIFYTRFDCYIYRPAVESYVVPCLLQ